MRARLYLSAPSGDPDELRREFDRRRLDRTVGGLWRVLGAFVAILAAGALLEALGLG
jgi:hypothetical protein